MPALPARVAFGLLAGPALLAAGSSPAIAQAAPRPELYAVRDVRLAVPEDAPRHTLILRDGRIERVQDVGAEVPPGARVIEGKGMLALPAFIDAFTHTGCATPTPVADRDAAPSPSVGALVDMREANRKGIQPAFRAADVLKVDADLRKRLRTSGFGLLLSAPTGQLLSGQSTLASSRDAPARDALLAPVEFDHSSFQSEGPGYPGTRMGAVAQLRQFFLDARRDQEIRARRAAGKSGPRPPYDADLEAILPALAQTRRVVCEAESVADIERWISLSDEFRISIAISGGRDAWKRANVLRDRGIPVFLTLDWGEEAEDPHAKDKKKEGDKPEEAPEKPAPESGAPKADETEGEYEAPLRVREEQRRLWEEKRDGAIRLGEAGVPFAFGTGKGSSKELLERVRTLVEKGLPADKALAALTYGSAELLGVGAEYGKLEPGFAASFALWTKDPLTQKQAQVAWIVTEGFPFELGVDTKKLEGKPDEGIDVTGTWTLEFEGPQARSAVADLKMEKDGAVRGTVRYKSANEEPERSGEFEGQVAGKKIRLTGQVKFGNFDAEVVLDGEIEKDEMTGTTTWKFSRREDVRKFKGTREPKRSGGDR